MLKKVHEALVSLGLHKCPGASATAPQVVHVYAIRASFGVRFLCFFDYFQHEASKVKLPGTQLGLLGPGSFARQKWVLVSS